MDRKASIDLTEFTVHLDHVKTSCDCSKFDAKTFQKLIKLLILLTRIKRQRVKGIEPSFQAWEAHVLPLNHPRFRSASARKPETNLAKLFLPNRRAACN